MPTKYTGQWDKSELRSRMESGIAYAECTRCGAQITRWTTVMSRICPKCNLDHGVDRLISEYESRAYFNKLSQRLQNKKLRKKFSSLISALEIGKVGVVSGSQLLMKEEGWANFVGRFLNDDCTYTTNAFTCLKCTYCGFVTVIEVQPGYNIRRGSGTSEASNYEIDFNCVKCGSYNQTKKVSVSYDSHSYYSKYGDPVVESLFDFKKSNSKSKWFFFFKKS